MFYGVELKVCVSRTTQFKHPRHKGNEKQSGEREKKNAPFTRQPDNVATSVGIRGKSISSERIYPVVLCANETKCASRQ